MTVRLGDYKCAAEINLISENREGGAAKKNWMVDDLVFATRDNEGPRTGSVNPQFGPIQFPFHKPRLGYPHPQKSPAQAPRRLPTPLGAKPAIGAIETSTGKPQYLSRSNVIPIVANSNSPYSRQGDIEGQSRTFFLTGCSVRR